MVEPPPRIVVVDVDDPLCDVSGAPAPEPVVVPPREVIADRVCMPGATWRYAIGSGVAWRARAEAYERCEERRKAAKEARARLTSADAGVE